MRHLASVTALAHLFKQKVERASFGNALRCGKKCDFVFWSARIQKDRNSTKTLVLVSLAAKLSTIHDRHVEIENYQRRRFVCL